MCSIINRGDYNSSNNLFYGRVNNPCKRCTQCKCNRRILWFHSKYKKIRSYAWLIYRSTVNRACSQKRFLPTVCIASQINQIPFLGCDKTYTGQTGCLLGTRIKEHRGSVRRHEKNSCLALHYMDTGHSFKWQDTLILGFANSQRSREAIEALQSRETSLT